MTATLNSLNERKLKLMHIGNMFEPEVKEFIPRVPIQRAGFENESINRVCVSSTMDGCMKAHPTVIYYMVEYMDAEYSCPYTHMSHFQMLLEKGKSGMFFRVYHFDLDEKDVYTPDFLHSQKYVPDCLDTQEHWVLNNCKPTSISYLLIEKMVMDRETKEFDIEYSLFDSLEDCGLYMPYNDFFFAYEKLYPNKGDRDRDRVYTSEEALILIEQMNKANELNRIANESYKVQKEQDIPVLLLESDDPSLPF